MRLRNIPRAGQVLADSEYVIKTPEALKGNWKDSVFQNQNPLHIEIGMGKGRFIIALAKQNPDINYIGIERYSSVLLRAVEKLQGVEEGEDPTTVEITPEEVEFLPNLRLICFDATQITEIFKKDEVDRVYLNFSDPWPKSRHARRRLTSPEYLSRYKQILEPQGQLEFKTDNRGLFDFSVETVNESTDWNLTACTYDLHHDESMNQGNIMTEYEEKFSSMDNPICKLIAKQC